MLLQLLRQAAWAPACVLVLHYFMVRSQYRTAFDAVHHFLGGAAIAFFLLQAILIASPIIGRLRPVASYLFAFALACVAAVFWEIAEFAFDQLLRTQIQTSLPETMADLIFGVVGAVTALGLIAVFRSGDQG
ncbi:MAG TPA: hypothetical protein VLJ57_18935 [Burkholderiaceae bacterium]|nr:hypothetical protein [Burkholderiaceae bacterium]